MKPRSNRISRAQKTNNIQGEGTNWVLIAGGALLSTLSIRLGYMLKQALDSKQHENPSNYLKGNGKISERRKSAGHGLQSNLYSFTQDDHGCFSCISGTEGAMEKKCPPDSQLLSEPDGALPLVTVSAPELGKENTVIWASSPDRLELPPKPFHHSNCSDSPCVSESGSDIFIKREVIQKLRQQLKRRDDMLLEMQDQIVELQNSLNVQLAHSTNLQLQLNDTNRDLFDSEGEIQKLRKAIADHCVGHVSSYDKSWMADTRNGHANVYLNGESKFERPEKRRDDIIEMLKREMGELKEVLVGKDYLLQSYKEQNAELALKMKQLQQKLDYQLPNIL
ncbi:Intracellular protein transport protein USO1 isoform 2 [Quillaja saponaria]|uniref:Intracellular protein transport protein USO1 isoform 2 n=1 Tax=Quillaja saponaria TaxID=32244 RepID=A0AAD7PCD0_QUISA|nr:Intracellular protein transport protein USO1 isoform 2 [Quillaja saponaria]